MRERVFIPKELLLEFLTLKEILPPRSVRQPLAEGILEEFSRVFKKHQVSVLADFPCRQTRHRRSPLDG